MAHIGGDCNRILLLHGIWMTGLELSLLRRRLTQCGFTVDTFRYRSLALTPSQNAERLNRYISQQRYDCLHLVAHSLGGLVLLHLFARFPAQPPGRIVLLGSPVQGSGVARHLSGRPGLRRLIGQAGEQGLLGGAPGWSGKRPLGVIAGTSGIGIGRLLGGVTGESDGTVSVSETRLDDASDVRMHRVGHMGMLCSRAVADDVAGFLGTGHFPEEVA